MRKIYNDPFLIFLIIAVLFSFFSFFPISSESIPLIETSAGDRKEISLTIYNHNFALVKENREVTMPVGISALRFWDISAHINPASVRIKSLNRLGGLEILEQNYEYDLINPQNLMDKYVGHEVKLLEKDDFSGAKGEIHAELLSNNQSPIYRIGEEIHIGHPGRVVLPKLPEDLQNYPSLLWKIFSSEEGDQIFEISYLTEELDWQADYSLVLNTDDTRGDLSGWVTIKNNSGIGFKEAQVQLIAGIVGRVKEPRLIRMKEADDYRTLSKGITEEERFEYHLYNLQEKVTLKDKQTKQVHLFSAERIPVKKELRYYGDPYYYHQRLKDQEKSQRVAVYLEFENRKTFHLGIALPTGIVRVYKMDSKGSIYFLGEDKISHTPEDEKVKIQIGYASGLVADRKQIDWKKPSSELLEIAWEIILRNQKKEAAWVFIMEPVPGDWEVLESSHHWQKEEAHTLRFDLSIAPKSEEKIRYRVRIRL